MQKNIIQLNQDHEIIILGNNKKGIKIKNIKDKLIIEEFSSNEIPNIYFYNTDLINIINFIFAYLLEEYNRIPDNDKAISHILNNHYELFQGKENYNNDIEKLEFQIITYLKKE